MRTVDHNGIQLATETFGDRADPACLLIMGATASMLGWPDELCTALADRGSFVVRFDHRDTGQSTTVPPGAATYAVEDMAEDAIAILDAYGVAKAHVTGMSLGGYIGQMLAILRPERVATLTMIGTEPLGWDGSPLPHVSVDFLDHFGRLGSIDWSDRVAVSDFLLETQRLCTGSFGHFDADREMGRIAQVLSRTGSIASMFNHASLVTRGEWTGRFREIRCPVLVLHGDEDPILPPDNGKAIANGIPGATFRLLNGVGHELPLPMISDLADLIAAHIRQGQV